MASRLSTALTDVKMFQNDIDKVVAYVTEVARKASLVGVFFSEREKVSALRHVSQYAATYKGAWRMIDMMKINDDFDAVVSTLSNEWHRHKHNPYQREPRAAALAADVDGELSKEEREKRHAMGKKEKLIRVSQSN